MVVTRGFGGGVGYDDDDDGGGCGMGMAAVVVLWWRWWGGSRRRGRRVAASDLVGRIDRLTRNTFGFGQKSPPEKFSGGGGVVVAGIRWWGGGRKTWERERDRNVSPNNRYDLMDANKKVDLEHVQCPPESKILTNIIKNHPLRFSIAASSSVPWIYMAQTIFHLPHANDNNHNSFMPPPSFLDMVPFYKQQLGFTMELKTSSSFKTTGLLQPWQTLWRHKDKVGMQIPDWMITKEMKHTEHYRMYAEVFGLDVPLTQSQPTESTQGIHRTLSAPRSPTPKKDTIESSAPKRSTVIRFCLPERRIYSFKLHCSLEGSEIVINEPQIPGTRLEPRSDKESPKVESTNDEGEGRREDCNRSLGIHTIPHTNLNLPRTHTYLVSSITEKTPGLRYRHLNERFLSRKSFDTIVDHLQDVMGESLPTMVDTHIKEQDDPQDDAHPEGENSAIRRQKSSEYEHLYDDEIPTKQVSQDIMEEVSLTIDEAKLKKMADEMLRQRCTSGDEHQYHIDQMKNFLKSEITFMKKGSFGPEKIVWSLHKFPAIIFNDDDIEERTSRWVNKCVKKFNPYARYGVEHWKNPHAKIFYIKKQKEPRKPKEENAIELLHRCSVIWERVHDFQLGIESYQQKVNLTAPTISFPGVEKHKMFSIIYEPVHGIIYKNSKKEKRVMRHSEIHKFCDATLNRVLEGLKSYNNDVKYGYVQRELTNDEVEYLKLFEEEIEVRLKYRNQMRRWEMYVNGRPLGPRRERPE
ncbi:hypothetical protein Tco_0371874 [Tanacetum coccineum]